MYGLFWNYISVEKGLNETANKIMEILKNEDKIK